MDKLPTLDEVKTNLAELGKFPPIAPYFTALVSASGQEAWVVSLGSLAATLLLILVLFGLEFICTLVCFMPPMIETLTALQSERTSQDTTMLKYWILFAFMQLFESSGISGWIPYFYYYTFKTVLLLWAWHMKGVETLYGFALGPKKSAEAVSEAKEEEEDTKDK